MMGLTNGCRSEGDGASDLSSCAGSELGSELTSLAELGSELTSLAGSELGLSSYRMNMRFITKYNIKFLLTPLVGNGNVTPYEQYLLVNDVSVVPSCASSVSNDAYVLHDNDAYVPHDPLVTKLNIYKEQVAIYEQRARAMKTVFENLEAEVDQNLIDSKSGEIERKNLHITNENLIANCIAQDVFFTVTDSAMTASRFHELFTAYTVAINRAVELEAENSKLIEKIKNDDHDSMVKASSKLEETRSATDRTLDFRALDFQITQLTEKSQFSKNKMSILGSRTQKLNSITRNYSVTPKYLAPGMYAIDVEPIPPRCRNNREVHLEYLKHLKESVATIHEIAEEARVERPLDSSLASACLYTKRSQELVEYAVDTCPKDFNKRDKKQATALFTRKKQVTFADQCRTHRPLIFEPRLLKTYDRGSLMAPVQPSTRTAPSLRTSVRISSGLALQRQNGICRQHFRPRSLKKRNVSTWSLNVYEMVKLTPGYISLGLVQNSVSPTPYVPPSKKDYEIMFQPLFDEYFNPPLRAVSPVSTSVVSPRAVDPDGSPSSTTIDQDVPSASTSPTI
uniref:Integrase, catalytic region, zinc finger, CCHC-type, peptidase aspartic, catalytic n=1 Tax=Tanacetum cinerariifolium TaxID=118510 RepID=A0A699GY15_TANCI|nr:hypothetical protein [Tanacetum cinerariifolium]